MIKVNIRHELHQYRATENEQKTLDDLVNGLLAPVMLDVLTYKASVDAVVTISDNYRIIPHCDQYSTLYSMQSLLPELIPGFE